jgi:hypothetical protein
LARTQGTGVEGLDGVGQVVFGTRQRRKVDHAIHRTVNREGPRDVLFQELEVRVAGQVRQIVGMPGQEIIQRHQGVTLTQQTVAKVRANKAGSTGNNDSQ